VRTLTRHQVKALGELLAEYPQAKDISLLPVTFSALDATVWSEADTILATVTISAGGTIRSHDPPPLAA
jgi:hypothetical protein